MNNRSIPNLLIYTLGMLAAVAIVLAAVDRSSSNRPGERTSTALWGIPSRAATIFRFLINAGDFPEGDGYDLLHQAVATLAALIAWLAPAGVVAVVLIRIFKAQPFIWRRQLSICWPWEVEVDQYRRSKQGTHDVAAAVRFYQRSRRMRFGEVKAEAFLRYEFRSSIDGTLVGQTVQLEVLGAKGTRKDARVWPLTLGATPFTLWIPFDSALRYSGLVTSVQGVPLVVGPDDQPVHSPRLLVRISATVHGFEGTIVDEHEYPLGEAGQQIGRYVGVDGVTGGRVRRWLGWDRFEEPARQAIFVFGAMMHPEELNRLYEEHGRPAPVKGRDYVRATLRGYRRTWSLGTDNTSSARPVYVQPRRPPYPMRRTAPKVVVLFLGIEKARGAATEGILLRADSFMVSEFDGDEGNYLIERLDLGEQGADEPRVETRLDFDGFRPDLIWTCVRQPRSAGTAEAAISAGTAVIQKSYFEQVRAATQSYDEELRLAFQAELHDRPRVPVVPLEPVVSADIRAALG